MPLESIRNGYRLAMEHAARAESTHTSDRLKGLDRWRIQSSRENKPGFTRPGPDIAGLGVLTGCPATAIGLLPPVTVDLSLHSPMQGCVGLLAGKASVQWKRT
jgi:hypothetical protein